MTNKGLAGSVRVNSLDKEGTSAMERHELRLDYSGQLRSIEPKNEALFYRPYGDDLSIYQSFEKHVQGAKRNASASKLLRHAFIQFPTSIEVTPSTEEMMLREAVEFINKTNGGRAVFRARLDRDEKGRHGVDVFFAPRYEKKTAKGVTDWISLTKFGKERARMRLGQKQEEKYSKKKKDWEPQFNKDGTPKMIWTDSAHFQGQVLQDEWFEHLRDVVGLDWVVRGQKKIGRDPDRVEPEAYGLLQDHKKLAQQREADIAEAIERNKMVERTARLAETARKALMDTARAKADEAEKRAVDAEARVRVADDALATLKATQKEAQEVERRIAALEGREKVLKASVTASERRLTAIETEGEVMTARVEYLRNTVKGLEAKEAELRNAVQLTGDGAENFGVAMHEVARVTSAAADMTLTNDLLATAQTHAFKNDQGKTRRFAQDDAQDNLVVRFITFGFQKAAELFEKLQSFARFNDEVERARTFPEPLMQMQNVVTGLREAIAETLTQLGVADQRPDVGEVDKNGDPPPVLELVFTRAAQKGKSLNNELAARLGPSGPPMR